MERNSQLSTSHQSSELITPNHDAPQSQVFLDDSKFCSNQFSLESGHATHSSEDAISPSVKENNEEIHYEYIVRNRRRKSFEQDMKFGYSCQHTMQEDRVRAIGFKVLNQKRRPSVISFTRVQDSSNEEKQERPLKKARKLEEISKANEELSKYQSKQSVSVIPQIIPSEGGKANYAFFGVYDGHGGPEAAEYIRQNLHGKIVEYPNFKEDPESAIREGFRKVEDEFINDLCSDNLSLHGVGTTAVMALIATSNLATTLYVAHVGHAEAIICRKGVPLVLTEPHNVRNQKEKDRINSVGGVIYEERLAHPKFNPHIMNIAVSRAIGDLYFKSDEYTQGKASGLIAEPQITKLELTTDDEFIILASNGFWEAVTKEKAIQFVKNHPKDYDTNLLCKELTDLANNGDKKSDDTTVLLIKLGNV